MVENGRPNRPHNSKIIGLRETSRFEGNFDMGRSSWDSSESSYDTKFRIHGGGRQANDDLVERINRPLLIARTLLNSIELNMQDVRSQLIEYNRQPESLLNDRKLRVLVEVSLGSVERWKERVEWYARIGKITQEIKNYLLGVVYVTRKEVLDFIMEVIDESISTRLNSE